MAKRTKTVRILTRVDEEFKAEARAYVDAAHMDMAELIRQGMVEYMENHPITKEKISE